MIGIIDYGMGNLRSVENALHHLGKECIISRDTNVLHACDKLILPGVGAFGDCMDNITHYGLQDFIVSEVKQGKPLLGICLGMQMLFDESYEKGQTKGFGLIHGKIVRIDDPDVSVPEIGWNELAWNHPSKLKDLLPEHTYVYYVHSYYASDMNEENLLAYSSYGMLRIPGIVCKNNVMGCQFHPEKSGEDGLTILKYFTEVFS